MLLGVVAAVGAAPPPVMARGPVGASRGGASSGRIEGEGRGDGVGYSEGDLELPGPPPDRCEPVGGENPGVA